MKTPPKQHTKRGKLAKNMSLDPDMIRATNAAVEAGMAKDFSEAVEQGLRLLLEKHGFPASISMDDLRSALTKSKLK